MTLTADHNLNLDSNLAGGSTENLILNATNGTILQNAGNLTAINLTANATGSGGLIKLTSATTTNHVTGSVTLTTAGNASLTNDTATSLTSAVGGTLSANITGSLGIGGSAGSAILGAGSISFGTFSTGGLSATASSGPIGQTGALTVTATASFTDNAAAPNAAITLTNGGNDLTGGVTLTTAGNASLTNDTATSLTSAVGGTLSANITGSLGIGGSAGSAILGAGSISFGTFSTGGLSATASSGPIGQTGALTVTATASFTDNAATPNAAITLTNNGNRLAGAVTVTTDNGNAALVDSVPLTVAGGTVGTGMLLLMAPGVTITGLVVSDTSTTVQAFGNGTAWIVGDTSDGFAPGGAPQLISDTSLANIKGGGSLTIASNSGADLYVNPHSPPNLASPGFGDLTLTADHNLNLDSNLAGGSTENLILNATNGTILQNAGNLTAINLTANATGSGGLIKLTSATTTNHVTGSVTLTTAGNASLTNDTATSLTSAVGGTLSANITGSLGIGGSAGSAILGAGSISFGTFSTGGLSATASSGPIGQTGALTVAATASFTDNAAAPNAAITLTNGGNDLTGGVTLTTAGNASLTNDTATSLTSAVGGTLSANITGSLGIGGSAGSAILGAGSISFGTFSTGGLSATASSGPIGQTGALTVAATASFTDNAAAPNAAITLTNGGNDLTGGVTLTTAGNASLTNDTATSLTSAVGGTLSANITGSLGIGGSAGSAILGAGSISFGTFSTGGLSATASSGPIGQTGALTVAATASFTDNAAAPNAAITLTNGGNDLTGGVTLTTAGNASLTNDTATSLTSAVGGTLSANITGSLGIGGSAGSAILGAGSISFGAFSTGGLSATASSGPIGQTGALTVAATASFTDNAATPNAAITLTNGGNDLTGGVTLTTAGNASLTNDTATSLTSAVGGTLSANITGSLGIGGSAGSAVLGAGSISFAGLAVGTDLTANAGGPITFSGLMVGRNATATATGPITETALVRVEGSSSFAGSLIDLGTSSNALTGSVTLTTAGNASLTNGLDTTIAAGSSVGGPFTVIDAGHTLTLLPASLTTGGAQSYEAATLLLNGSSYKTANGAFTVTGNTVVSDGATIDTHTGNGNIAFNGTVDGMSPSDFLALTAGTGAITFGGAVGAIHPLQGLTATGGSIAFVGPVTIAGNLSLEATSGNISQNAAFTVVGASSFTTDALNAAITITHARNALSGVVTLRTGANGSASLTNDVSTTLASVSVGGTLTVTVEGGNLTLDGDIAAGQVSLNVAGTVNQTGGIIAASNLSGSTVGGASFTMPNQVGTFGSFTNAGSGDLTFVDAVSFSTTGTLSSAGNLFLTGPGINLAGNADAGGMISVASSSDLAANGSLQMGAGTLIKFGGTSFTQTGTLAISANTRTFEIETGSGLTQANLGCNECKLAGDIVAFANVGNESSAGPIVFQNLSAPETNVLIWAGAGSVTGSLNVKGLGISGGGGSASLTGTINGIFSTAAANIASKGPKPDNAYRINDCAIGTPNCITLPQIVPVLPLPTNFVNLLQVAAPSDPLDIERLDTGSEDGL